MRNSITTDWVAKQVWSSGAIVAGAAGAVTGQGARVIDLTSASTNSAILQNVEWGTGSTGAFVKGTGFDCDEIVFVCSADCGGTTTATVTFQVVEHTAATITSNRLASATNVTGAAITITASDEHKTGLIRLRMDRGTVTKRYLSVNVEAATTDAVAATCTAMLHVGSGQVAVTQDLAAVSVE